MRLVGGFDVPHVAPVGVIALGGARDLVEREVVQAGVARLDERGHDVAAHVGLGVLVLRVRRDRLEQAGLKRFVGGVSPADKLTDRQIAARVRNYFQEAEIA